MPHAAVQVGQASTYVFVVKPDNTAEMRPVVDEPHHRRQERDRSKGLEPGEQVVTDGQVRLTNGSRVEIRSAERQSKPGAPS